jgi:methionine-rich copper-binding protein CopC
MKFLSLAFIGFAFTIPYSAHAHAHLKSSSPKENAVVKELPRKIVLTFNEALEPTMSKVEVTGAGGKPMVADPVPNQTDPRLLEYAFREQAEGKTEYTVNWKAVSKDTHTMKGSYKFTVDPKVK